MIRANRIFASSSSLGNNMVAFSPKCDDVLFPCGVSAYRQGMNRTIYKIVHQKLWREAERTGAFEGAPIDHQDGFIHFSTADQVEETATKHFSEQEGLLLVAIDAEVLGPSLKFEPSRGGALFPHLYATLPMAAVKWVRPLPLDEDGLHRFGELEQ